MDPEPSPERPALFPWDEAENDEIAWRLTLWISTGAIPPDDAYWWTRYLVEAWLRPARRPEDDDG